jgi:hypothetical protein
MTHPQGCADRREAVAALVMGALPIEEAAEVQAHVACCEECRRLRESLRRQEADLLWAFERIGSGARDPKACRSQPAPARRWPVQAVARAKQTVRSVVRPRTTVKMAIAAAILAGVVGVWALSLQSSRQAVPSFAILAQPAYATVLREIDKARSVRYTRAYQEDGRPLLVGQQTVRDGGLMRTVMPDGKVMIRDRASGELLTLHPQSRRAVRMRLSRQSQQRYVNSGDWIRTLHDRKGVFTGQELLDGTLTNIYRADQPYEQITIWTNAWTYLPVRVEMIQTPCTDKDIRVPSMDLSASDFTDDEDEKVRLDSMPNSVVSISFWEIGLRENKVTIVLSDFAWDLDCDDSLFSLTPPDGYHVDEMTKGHDAPEDESSLAKALRFWAETSDGRFPENINMLSDCKPKLVGRYREVGPPEEAFRQAVPMMNTVLAGMAFAQVLKIKDNWHYAGKDVVFGEAGKPLCWWQPEGSETFRVIYGDLSIRDVPPEELPQSAAEVPATQP